MASIVLLVAAAAGVFLFLRPATSHNIAGQLKLAQANGTGYSNYTIPSGASMDCSGLGGYSDIQPGSQILVKDETGKVIGSGQLEQGHLDIDLDGQLGAVCVFPFTVPSLPDAGQYQVGMGNRGSIAYSLDDLVKANWSVTLTLGP